MRWRVAAAIALLTVTMTVDASASAAPEPNVSVATFIRGPIRGVVYARNVRDFVDVRLALHRLDAGQDYEVIGSAASCPQVARPIYDTWTAPFTAQDESVFRQGQVPRNTDNGPTASVRVFEVVSPFERSEIACVAGGMGLFEPPPAPRANAAVASFVRGPFRGVVYSRALGTAGVDARLSLFGLAADSTYVVVGSTRACGRPSRPAADEVWAKDVDTDADGGPVFRHVRVERRLTFPQYRSTRINLIGEFGNEVEQACVPGVAGRVMPA